MLAFKTDQLTNHGFVLPVAISLVVIIAMLGSTMFWVSRHHLNQSDRLAKMERAYHIANSACPVSGINFDGMVKFLNSSDPATFPKKLQAPDGIRFVVEKILDPQGYLVKSVKFELKDSTLDYIRSSFGADSLSVEFEMKRVSSLNVNQSGTGVIPDPFEGAYIVRIIGRANYQGVEASVNYFKEAKFVNILPPVVSKFVLFVRQHGFFEENTIQDFETAQAFKRTPLNVFAGPPVAPGSLSTQELSALLLKNG